MYLPTCVVTLAQQLCLPAQLRVRNPHVLNLCYGEKEASRPAHAPAFRMLDILSQVPIAGFNRPSRLANLCPA
jgi:hypothetical protein